VGRAVLDADIIIGFLNTDDAQHVRAVEELRPWLAAPHTRLVPAGVYAEILVGPLRAGREDVVERFIEELGMEIVPVDAAIARQAALIRAEHTNLRLPDALALATAIERRASLLSLDERLLKVARQVMGKGRGRAP
jgi:predicted nucleic acid-binding protein